MPQNKPGVVEKIIAEKGIEYLFREYALYQEERGALGLQRVEVVFPESAQDGAPLFTLLTVVHTPGEGLHEYGCYPGKGIDHLKIQNMLQSRESRLAPKGKKKWNIFEQLIQQWQTSHTTWQEW